MDPQVRRFTLWMALLFGIVAFLPFAFGLGATPDGSLYLGHNYALDDHMVYAAWMRQAMDGAFFFDNRFTVDPQAGQTVHLYFLLLGWFAKLVGIPWASALARTALSIAFVFLASRLVSRLTQDVFVAKLAIALTIVGGGIGFLVWHNYGQAIVRPGPSFLTDFMMGRLPIDVWQPEGFVFASMLTNGLFMVSLCLILLIFESVLEAEASWKSVLRGAILVLILTNIHTYDTLLIGLVLIGFLAAAAGSKTLNWAWVLRSAIIMAGAIPAIVWFVHVLRVDTVFQARAATPTYSAGFRQLVFGYLPLMVLGAGGLLAIKDSVRRVAVVAAGILVLMGCVLTSAKPDEGFWLGWPVWCLVFGLALVGSYLLAGDNHGKNLVVSWALVGLTLPYLPTLFQRKLTMGLSIPWAILAALAISLLAEGRDRAKRNLATILVIIVCSATGVRWLAREGQLAQTGVSNTVLHPTYVSNNVLQIIAYLNKVSGRKVVLAMPGIWSKGNEPDVFGRPYMPDLNPILTGLTGAYTYAGHWSETPNYNSRRSELTGFFTGRATQAGRLAFAGEVGADYIVCPVVAAFPELGVNFDEIKALGTVVVAGPQFDLVKLPPR